MAAFNFHKRQTRRWWYAGVTLVAAAFVAVMFVGGAGAVLSGGTTFEGNDGNLVVNTTSNCTTTISGSCTDWASFVDGSGNPSGSPVLNVGIDNRSGSADNSFGQGTKEDNSNVTVVTGSIPPNKSDLTRFYEASELVNNNVYLYLAWERSNVLGNANMDFEIEQNPAVDSSTPPNFTCPDGKGSCTLGRTNGDVLVTYDFPGSGSPVLGILRWLTVGGLNPTIANNTTVFNKNSDCFSANTLPCWGDRLVLNGGDSEGAVNNTGVVDPIEPTGLNHCPAVSGVNTCPAGTFGEAAINLTAAGVISQSNGCQFGQAATFLKSRSSSSFTSEIKDFIAPTSTPIFANCGAISINKTSTKGSALEGATFDLCTNSDVTSSADCTAPTGITNPAFTTDSSGDACVDGLVFGTYYVIEDSAPSGYNNDNTSPTPAGVSTSGSCPSNVPATDQLSFTDTPLTDVTLDVSSEASGGTNSAVSCVDSNKADIGNSPQPDGVDLADTSTYGDPVAFSATGLTPGTYTCTVIIDP
jgi:prealbumin domain-containing protein